MGNFLNLVYDEGDVTKESITTYMDSYLGIKDYRVFHINNIPSDNEKYYYFFEYRYYLVSYLVSEKKLPFSDTVLSLLKNNPSFNLILSNDAESDDDILIEALDVVFKNMGIDTNKIVVINCNEKNNEIKNRLNTNIITHTTNNGKFAYSNEFSRWPYDYKEKKDFLFMTYNRHVKIHRFALLVKLMKHNIIDNTDWSWVRGYEVRENYLRSDMDLSESWFLEPLFNTEEIKEHEKEIMDLSYVHKKKSIYETNYEFDFPPFGFDAAVAYANNPYSNSYINIVTETNFDKEDIILPSEKSYVPLYFSQIPIIMASSHHIKKMKELHGFDFFDDVVNHDYDNELNYKKRFNMIVDEIIRLNSKREDIEYFFKHNKERFDNNRKIVVEMKKDKKDYNFYKSLI